MSVVGYIHSIESCGTVDGPGIRYIVFFQGCPLRCKYCHNPDTWKVQNGKQITVEELMKDISSFMPYMQFSGGGVTASGGEPTLQPQFLLELFKACKEKGIHTALDTSGFFQYEKLEQVLEYTDLILLDIKQIQDDKHLDLTGLSNRLILENALKLSQNKKKMWIRYVVVPELTDNLNDAEMLAEFISKLETVERVEILPFHKMGEYKWAELGLEYTLADTLPPSKETIQAIKEIFQKHNLPIIG